MSVNVTVFTQQKLISGKMREIVELCLQNLYFVYFMCLISCVGFFVFYNFLHLMVCLSCYLVCNSTESVMSHHPHLFFCTERAKAVYAVKW